MPLLAIALHFSCKLFHLCSAYPCPSLFGSISTILEWVNPFGPKPICSSRVHPHPLRFSSILRIFFRSARLICTMNIYKSFVRAQCDQEHFRKCSSALCSISSIRFSCLYLMLTLYIVLGAEKTWTFSFASAFCPAHFRQTAMHCKVKQTQQLAPKRKEITWNRR